MKNFLFFSTLVFSLLNSPIVQAISEAGYAQAFNQNVRTYFKKNSHTGTILGKKQLPLYFFKVATSAQAASNTIAVVIQPGRSEYCLKYLEVVYDLRQTGYTFYCLDQRGQGLSGRFMADRQIGYVDEFEYYVDDLKIFVDTLVKPQNHKKYFLLGHSMGGAISSMYIQKHPNDFQAIATSAPMLQIDTGKYNEKVAFALSKAFSLAGQGQKYAFGEKNYDPSETVATSDVTHSEARFNMNQAWKAEMPDVVLGGASFGWIYKGISATWDIQDKAGKVTIPYLMMIAGEEQIVVPAGQKAFCSNINQKHPGLCIPVIIPGARHETLMEVDAARQIALNLVKDFFAKNQ